MVAKKKIDVLPTESPTVKAGELVNREQQYVDRARARTGKPLAPERGLGDRLREVREKAGLSQLGLSELTKKLDPEGKGISRTVLTGYERGNFLPGTRELRVLHDALGLTPNFLVLGTQTPVVSDQYVEKFVPNKDTLQRARRKLKALKPRQLEALVVILNAVAPDLDDIYEEALALDQDSLRAAVIEEAMTTPDGK